MFHIFNKEHPCIVFICFCTLDLLINFSNVNSYINHKTVSLATQVDQNLKNSKFSPTTTCLAVCTSIELIIFDRVIGIYCMLEMYNFWGIAVLTDKSSLLIFVQQNAFCNVKIACLFWLTLEPVHLYHLLQLNLQWHYSINMYNV